MITPQMLYAQLCLPTERKYFIKKITKGDSRVKNKDPEVEAFQKKFLEEWKGHDKKTRMNFCVWILDSGTDEGFMYAYKKKDELKLKLGDAVKSPVALAKKVAEVFKDEKQKEDKK